MQIPASPVCFLHISMLLLMNAILFNVTSGVYLPIRLLMLDIVSDAQGTTSWLDHVLSTHSSHSTISDMAVNYDCVSSDFPFCQLTTGTGM